MYPVLQIVTAAPFITSDAVNILSSKCAINVLWRALCQQA